MHGEGGCQGDVGGAMAAHATCSHVATIATCQSLWQAGRCTAQIPPSGESCLAQEWLADSLLLLVSSGSSLGLELSYCSAWGDPPAND